MIKLIKKYLMGVKDALRYAYPIGAAENANQWNNKFDYKPNTTYDVLEVGKHHIRL